MQHDSKKRPVHGRRRHNVNKPPPPAPRMDQPQSQPRKVSAAPPALAAGNVGAVRKARSRRTLLVSDSFKLPSPRKRHKRQQKPLPSTNGRAANALSRVLGWQAEIAEKQLSRAGIARREGLTRARVTQLMGLLSVPEPVQAALLSGEDDQYASWSVRQALRVAASAAARHTDNGFKEP